MSQQPLRWTAITAVAGALFLAGGFSASTRPDKSNAVQDRTAPASQSTLAEDQIFNDAGSTTSVSFSLVEGGMSPGSSDGGGNIDADPLYTDSDGADNIPGSVDDNVDLQSDSPSVDAGNDTLLPTDIFDIDGDGNTSEPFPMDISGAARAHNGANVDMGAHESTATDTFTERRSAVPNQPVEFSIPYPNPITESGELTFTVPSSERVEVAVYDVLGRKRGVLFDAVAQMDRQYRLEISASELVSGVYFARLTSSSFDRTAEFVVVR